MRPITDLARRVEPFRVISDYVPAGDQPSAIAELTKRIGKGEQILCCLVRLELVNLRLLLG